MAYRYSVAKLQVIAEHWWELITLAENGCLGYQNKINKEDWTRIVESKVDFERALEATGRKVKFQRMLKDETVNLDIVDFKEMARWLNKWKKRR